jgi:hypothetical protein
VAAYEQLQPGGIIYLHSFAAESLHEEDCAIDLGVSVTGENSKDKRSCSIINTFLSAQA